ncbi:MAG TPA: asparagine synthase (glutamine-hydrolyzing) [Aurantimonas coralicida]|uniref:Glutamine amidotransferase type-2 domain-containing protein n=1 Tax=marine sediment metagenome TaxID=412755 RepID=A0A0F9TUD7_9ZZZZ|nr:asparagine synthase (glutamine-hydrolyzing) [Aurantimonas coralicida]
MCAIAGCISFADAPDCRELLAAMRHRGPDEARQWVDCPVAIGAARLAIVDAEHGAQPMRDPESGTAVVFNGEITNAAELREELSRRGHRFRGRCDTEVVLAAFAAWGEAAADRLTGMFAIAVRFPDRLLLVRDRHGIKPLAFHCDARADRFLFASEAKAIAAVLPQPPRLDLTTLADFAILGTPIDGATFFETITELHPGHMMAVTWQGHVRVGPQRAFGGSARATTAAKVSEAQADERFEAALLVAVRRHCIADTEIVVSLSGGLDSAVLALAVAELTGRPPRTFTVAEDCHHPDAVAAARIARSLGAEHDFLAVSFDAFLATIPATLRAVEQPDLAAGPLFALLCHRIGLTARCCLNGEGADELMGGYAAYRTPERSLAAIETALRRVRRTGLTPRDGVLTRIEALRAADSSGGLRDALLAHDRADPLERGHLQPVDRLSMAASVEMRVPYLDDDLGQLLETLPPSVIVGPPGASGKAILRRFAARRYGERARAIVTRPKLMMPEAARGHLTRFRGLCERAIPDRALQSSEFGGLFDDKSDFVLFEMFRRQVFAKGEPSGIREVMAEIAGRPEAALAAL